MSIIRAAVLPQTYMPTVWLTPEVHSRQNPIHPCNIWLRLCLYRLGCLGAPCIHGNYEIMRPNISEEAVYMAVLSMMVLAFIVLLRFAAGTIWAMWPACHESIIMLLLSMGPPCTWAMHGLYWQVFSMCDASPAWLLPLLQESTIKCLPVVVNSLPIRSRQA